MERYAHNVSRRLVGCVLICAVLLVGGSAVAQDVERYRKQLETYRQRLANLSEEDRWGVTSADRSRVEEWLASAEVLLAEGETEKASMRLTEAGDLLTLIEAEIGAKRLEEAADEQEQKFFRLQNEVIPEIEKTIDQLQTTLEHLNQQLEATGP